MKIEENLKEIETDQYLSLYYSLLDFRCKVLVEGINITKESFEKVEELSGIKDQYL
ncbi:response regulator aspartate phosphatase, partial [Bacillus thuringiensis]